MVRIFPARVLLFCTGTIAVPHYCSALPDGNARTKAEPRIIRG